MRDTRLHLPDDGNGEIGVCPLAKTPFKMKFTQNVFFAIFSNLIENSNLI